MNIQQLRQYWTENGEHLYTYSPSQVDRVRIDTDTYLFLTTCGLPSDAAPFLNFGELQENRLQTPNHVFNIEFEGLDDYLMFGSNGSGDPLCLDTKTNYQIVYLNHDKYFEKVFINESLMKFGICLTLYRDFVLSLIEKKSNNFDRRKFTDTEFGQLKANFKSVDNRSLSDNTFWSIELDALQWERDNE